MSLRNLFEGQDDKILRLEAGGKLASFIEDLKTHPEVAKVGLRNVLVKMGSLESMPTDLSLRFNFRPGNGPATGQFMPLHGGGGGMIVFDIQADVNQPDFDPLNFVFMKAAEYREAWIHEYVHYLDWKRIGYDSWKEMSQRQKNKAGPEASYRSYAQDPIEQNAFFQQTADSISSEVSPDAARRMDVNAFYNLFLKRMRDTVDPEKFYRQRQMPGLKKRVAQLYNDIKSS